MSIEAVTGLLFVAFLIGATLQVLRLRGGRLPAESQLHAQQEAL